MDEIAYDIDGRSFLGSMTLMDEIADAHQIIWLTRLQTWPAAGQLAAGQLAAGRARPAAAHRPPRGRPPQHGVRPSSYAGRGHPRRVIQKIIISRPAKSNIKDQDSPGWGVGRAGGI